MRILALTYERDWELEADGHEILYIDRNEIDRRGWPSVLADISSFAPELIIEREFNDGRAIYDIIYRHFAEIPKAWWWIDSHIAYEGRKDYAKNFDYVFLAVSRNVEPLKAYLGHDRVYHLPLCWPYRSDLISLDDPPKDYPISFVGRWKEIARWFPERQDYVDKLQDHYGDRFHAVTDYEHMLSILRRSQVSFNYAIRNDLNFRFFEVLGCGAQLVTNPVSDLFQIDGLEQRLSLYRNFSDLTAQIDDLLSGKTKHDTQDNRRWIQQHHCLVHRLRYIVDTITCK